MKHRLLRYCWLSALLLGLPLLAQAQPFFTDAGHAEFTSHVPLHTFTGTSDDLVGQIDLEEDIVDFYLDLTTLRTGIGRRDRDMRRTLNTDEHPFAEFYGELVSSFDPDNNGPQEARVRGDFTVNGVSREVEIDGTLEMTGEGLRVEAAWELDITDHEMEPPSLLFARVDEVQEVRIEALLRPDS